MRRTASIAIIIMQASLCFAVRLDYQGMKQKAATILSEGKAKRIESQVVGTRASELTSRSDTRTDRRSDNLHHRGEYKIPVRTPPRTCNNQWRQGEEVDRGNYGLIQEVRKSGQNFGTYVLKVALSNDTITELEKEITIMSQIKCKGILTVTDPAPCDSSGKRIEGSFVMPQMVPNLWKWYDKTSVRTKTHCRDTIQKQLSDALKCLHDKNYIHGDFKGDQVLYKGLDEYGCPVGLEISDFGLSMPRTVEGKFHYDGKYDAEYYWISGHLMGAMFSQSPDYKDPYKPLDPQAITHPDDPGFYRISSTIDWCSFLYEMLTNLAFGDDTWMATLSFPTNLKGMDCGWMSRSRNIRIVAGG